MSTTQPPPERPMMKAPAIAAEDRRVIGKTVARDAGGVKVHAFFEAHKGVLQQMLPQHMTAERFLRVAMNSLRVTPKLLDCTVESLFAATLACAQLGLEPNTPLGHVYLIPFRNNRKDLTEVQVIIGYQGFVRLARNSGEIQTIAAQPVYEKDDYEFDFFHPDDPTRTFHRPFRGGPRGEIVGAWAMARFKDGGMAFEFMPRADIDKIRDGSQAYRTAMRYAKPNQPANTPWVTAYDQMAAKTAIRRLAKRLPLSIEMAAAIAMDERDDRRATQGLDRAMRQALADGAFDLSVVSIGSAEDEGAGDEPPPPAQAPVPQAAPRRSSAPGEPPGEAEEPRARKSDDGLDFGGQA